MNPRFSLRAFARQIGLSPGFLSGVLQGTKSLSGERARDLAKTLGLNESQASEFVGSVERELERSPRLRGEAAERALLALDRFELIADWYHFAILDLTTTADFDEAPEWIGKRLGISTETAHEALERLVRLGHLERIEGRLRKTNLHFATTNDIPSRALRSLHKQMMCKAMESLEERPVHERDVTGTTIAMDSKRIALAKEEIRAFRHRLADLLSAPGDKPDGVFQLNIQFFELTQPVSGKEESK